MARRVYDQGFGIRRQGDVLDTFRFLMELGLDPMAEDKQRTAVVSFPLSPTRRWEVMCKC